MGVGTGGAGMLWQRWGGLGGSWVLSVSGQLLIGSFGWRGLRPGFNTERSAHRCKKFHGLGVKAPLSGLCVCVCVCVCVCACVCVSVWGAGGKPGGIQI